MPIPDRMKAAVLFAPHDLRIVEKKVARPGRQEVLLKVEACAICGTDLKILAQGWPGQPPYGEFTPGHEYAGTIVALGEGTVGFSPGDRVAIEPHKGCGICSNCLRGAYTVCLNYGNRAAGHRHYGMTADGAMRNMQ